MVRNVGLRTARVRPLRSGVSDRQLIWFHTWKKHVDREEDAHLPDVQRGELPALGVRAAAGGEPVAVFHAEQQRRASRRRRTPP